MGEKIEDLKSKKRTNQKRGVKMKVRKVFLAILLSLSFCFVSGMGYGGQDEYLRYKGKASLIDSFLLEARVNYVMRNPTDFLNVQMHYDLNGDYSEGLPGNVDSKGKIFVWVVDNRDIFSDKFGIALLNTFKISLEKIYSSIVLAVITTDMDTDIVAEFLSEEIIPLGYFYQGEYHLWEDKEEVEEPEIKEVIEGFEWFQTGNTQSITQLQPKQSRELENNRMGDMYTLHPAFFIKNPDTSEDPDMFADRISEKGLKWMRLSIDVFDWIEVEDIGTYSEHYIHPEQDRAITALKDNGINTLYTIVYWDEEIQVEEGYSRFKTEEEIQRYLDYVQFIVHHFKDRIEYYSLLNEPNIGEGTQQYVKVEDHINLIRRTIPVIREEYPEAKIVVGEVTPFTEPGVREYFFEILRSDVMPLVDGVVWHPGAGTSPEYMADYYYDYPNLVQEIKDVAFSNGFNGEYLATEMHWRTSESLHPSEYDEYSKTSAAKYLARGIVTHLSTTSYAGIAECLECQPKMNVIQSLSNMMAGAKPTDLPIQIQSEATNIKSHSFSLSNGDKLIALWTDGIAVDDDPGVKATLTIPNFSAETVMGIDVLKAYQQSIKTSNEDGNLVIQDLIVRDYPLILHITKPN